MKKIALVLVAALLAGCASIPTSGPVKVLGNVIDEGEIDSVRVIVRPPTGDMTPDEIVQGFIAAQASTTNGYAGARQYMTPAASNQWQPTQTLVIDQSVSQTQMITESDVRFTTGHIGTLGEDHRYILTASQQNIDIDFTVVETDSGWRVDSAPQTALMTKRDFFRNYKSSIIYFMNDDFTRLVPDVVWVSRSDSTAPTRLMRILLAGPDGLLGQALRTAIPAGSELAIGAVTNVDGLMTVELNAAALRVGQSQRIAMLAQIVWTLTTTTGVNLVLVKAGGQNLEVANTSKLSRNEFKGLNPDRQPPTDGVFYVDEGLLSRGPLGEGKAFGTMPNVQALTVSANGLKIAAVSNGSAILTTSANPSTRERVAQDVVGVDFDLRGRLWLVKSDGSIWIKNGDNPIEEVLGLPRSQKALSIAHASDGARVAIITSDGAEPHLNIFGVINSSTGVSLTEPIRLEQEFTETLDASWPNSTELMVLARKGVDQPAVRFLPLDGTDSRSIGGPFDLRQVFSRFDLPAVAVTTQGNVWKFVAGEWTLVNRVTAMAYVD